MTERHGYGHRDRDEPGGGQRPSGRGAVAERRAGASEEAADREESAAQAAVDDAFDGRDVEAVEEQPRSERERSGAFEPHPAPGAPTAAATSIFDAGREEDAVAGREEAAVAEEAAAVPSVAEPAAPAGPLGSLDADGIRNRFLDIQAGFVDEPRQAVQEAARFVDELVQQVTDALQAQRGQLQEPLEEGSTEDLRLALRAYRQFVDRLLGLAG
jgi:hypothetical protein